MIIGRTSDLSTSFILQNSGNGARSRLNLFTQELASGQKVDTGKNFGADVSKLAGVLQDKFVSIARNNALSENLTKAEIKQSVLEKISQALLNFSNSADIGNASRQAAALKRSSSQARQSLEAFVSDMNIRFDGQSVFSGTATQKEAFKPLNETLTELVATLTGSTTTSEVLAKVEIWMNDPAQGYSKAAYQGNSNTAKNIRLDDDRVISLEGHGNSVAIRETFKSLALAAIANEDSLNLTQEVKRGIIGAASLAARQAEGMLTELRADVGYTQSLMENALTRGRAKIAFSEKHQLDLVGADPYETATRLQAAEQQLERIYMLTARASRLSLLEHM